MDKRGKLIRLLAITAIGFSIAIIYHYVMGRCFGRSWPYNTFLYEPKDRFMDFYNSTIFSKYLLKGQIVYYNNMWNAYMPLVNWIGIPFTLGSRFGNLLAYVSLIIIFFCGFCFYFLTKITDHNRTQSVLCTLLIVLTSYPLLFLLDRGNYEGFIFIFLGFFLYFFQRGQDVPAIAFLALGTSLKPFLGVFIVLYMSDKKFKECLSYVFLTGYLYFVELAALPGGFFFNLQGWLADLSRYDNYYVKGLGDVFSGHTLYNVLNVLNSANGIILHRNLLKMIYLFFGLIVFALISLYIIRYEKVFWRKLYILTLAMIVLPFSSSDYSLVHLYFPIFFFINESRTEKKYDSLIILLSGLLLIPKQYFLLFDYGKIGSLLATYGVSIFLNPVIVYMLFFVLIVYGMTDYLYAGKNDENLLTGEAK